MKRLESPIGAGTPPAHRFLEEIATFLKCGTCTVQRWEREEGLPVHRLQHDKLGSVYAFEHELNVWWAGRKPELESPRVETPEGLSVAVLPFRDLSQEHDHRSTSATGSRRS